MPLFTPAKKEQLKGRVAIDGPTGAGKTWTALQWATIIADGAPIGVIDTENRSAAYYAPEPDWAGERLNPWDPPYQFGHLPVSPPYDPRKLTEVLKSPATLEELTGDGVLVIDSLTPYWTGEGGTLDIVDDATKRSRSRNSYTDGWGEGTPAQRAMIDAIVHAPFHVIVTMRSKMAYVMEERTKDGRTTSVPRKVGLQPEQRAGVEYEFTLVVDMDLDHELVVSKSRCDRLADVVMPKGRSHESAIVFRDWLGTGILRVTPQVASAMVHRFTTIGDEAARRAVWDQFRATFGHPKELAQDRVEEATAWLAEHVQPDPEPQPSLSDALAEARQGGTEEDA